MCKVLDLSQIRKAIETVHPQIQEDGLVARILNSENSKEVEQYQRLRYDYYVKTAGLIPEPPGGKNLEFDKYDEHAIHFGVFDLKKNLVGYARLILPGQHGLQVYNTYQQLVHPRINMAKIDTSTCVESSRVTAIPEVGKKRRHVARLLYKAKYQITKGFGFKHWYVIGEMKMIRALRFCERYPFEIVGSGKEYLGAVRYPALMSLEKMDAVLLKERPEYYYWMNEGLKYIPTTEPSIYSDSVITDILRQGT